MQREELFERPASVARSVWGRHGTVRIEDVPENRKEEVVRFMIDYYVKDEPLSTIVTKTAPYSEEELYKYFMKGLNDNVSLFALDEADNDKLVGVSAVRVMSRCDPHLRDDLIEQFPSARDTLLFLAHCMKNIDYFTYEIDGTEKVVDHVMYPMGLYVLPEYRGRGIGGALIKARHKLSYAAGIGASNGLYTSIYSQKAILHFSNMKILKEVFYSEYIVQGQAKFASLNPPHPSAKVIGGLITKEMAHE